MCHAEAQRRKGGKGKIPEALEGVNYPVVRSLTKGDNLNIVGNPTTYRDKQGLPWLYVAKEGSAKDIKIRCFVRANT